MSIRTIIYLCLLTFVVTLAILIGWQLSNQAMAVMVGVIAGVTASIPTSLIVVWATLRNRPEPQAGGRAGGRAAGDHHSSVRSHSGPNR
jgi:preprotein translocase subunit SecF